MKVWVFTMLCALALAAVPASAADLNPGDPAPDFTLQATDGKTYTLSSFKDKQPIVLAWFPKAFTQGCTIECKSLAENGGLIKKYDVTYFMISVDPLEATADNKGNKAFAEAMNADFPLLSDPAKTTAKAYGVLNEERGTANRWTFYIGKDGKIQAIDKAIKMATSAEDMAAKLGELKTATRK